MAAAIDLERLLDALELSCACCLQYFTEPVRLPGCGHSFCRGCIARHCSGRQRAACPLCREGFELKDLRPNRELVALVNLIPQEVKEKELETRGERKPSGAVACNDRSSPGEKVRPQFQTLHQRHEHGTWLGLCELYFSFHSHSPRFFTFPMLILALL